MSSFYWMIGGHMTRVLPMVVRRHLPVHADNCNLWEDTDIAAFNAADATLWVPHSIKISLFEFSSSNYSWQPGSRNRILTTSIKFICVQNIVDRPIWKVILRDKNERGHFPCSCLPYFLLLGLGELSHCPHTQWMLPMPRGLIQLGMSEENLSFSR